MSTLGSFIWSIADQLRGPYRPNQYGTVILPFTILRRLDCILEPDRTTDRELAAKYENPNRLRVEVSKATGRPFYNTSNYSFANILADADGLADNLTDYVDRFSADVDVFEYFEFKKEILGLEKAGILREVVKAFGAIDLHPARVSNSDMGDAFEYIIRKFNEAANETSGDHYTPRDAIKLLVDLLFAEKDAALTEAGIVRSLYDPTAGTGGMLSLAEEHLLAQNPDARLSLYGQEYNPQSYAICKSDLLAKGHDGTNIAFGNTLTDDAFTRRQFDFGMSNPPYGVDWKQYVKAITKERDEAGPYGRFAPGLPSTSDGQMLFLLHLAHKMRAPEDGGGRVGIVMNGSPLFNGGAGSGPSNIRQWLLEHDLVEAIVALPTNMFFNTASPPTSGFWTTQSTPIARARSSSSMARPSGPRCAGASAPKTGRSATATAPRWSGCTPTSPTLIPTTQRFCPTMTSATGPSPSSGPSSTRPAGPWSTGRARSSPTRKSATRRMCPSPTAARLPERSRSARSCRRTSTQR